MSDKLTEMPKQEEIMFSTNFYVPIGKQNVIVLAKSKYDPASGSTEIPAWAITAAPPEKIRRTFRFSSRPDNEDNKVDAVKSDLLIVFIAPVRELRCRSKKRFQKLLMSLPGYDRNAAAKAAAGNYDRWTCHGLERSECYQLKWLKAIFPAPQFDVCFESPVDNAPLKTKDFAYKHFMGRIAAENLWREHEQERLKGKENDK